MSRLLNSSVFLNLFRVLLPKHKRQMCNVVLNTNIRPASKDYIPKALYGGRYTITMLPGAGVGPELMDAVRKVFLYAGVPIDIELINLKPNPVDNDLSEVLTSIRRNGVAIKGNIESDSTEKHIWSRDVTLRNELDLFVHVLHCKMCRAVKSRHKDVDLILIRQNTEGEYAMLEHESIKGVVESMKVITRSNVERVARYAFTYARECGRKKVTTVHKCDAFPLSDVLFLNTCRAVAKDFPEIEHNDILADTCVHHLVTNPNKFDVLIMTNLYGTIVMNCACGLINGAGVISSKNYGENYAVFECGSRVLSVVEKNVANPIVMINAGIDMLRYLDLDAHADLIENAVERTLCINKTWTPDLGGTATTIEVVDSILKNIHPKEIF